MAGAFGPVAFLWFVLGYFQQNKNLALNTSELQNSVAALNLQAIELKNSVEQQSALVKISKTQVDLEVSKRKEDMQRQVQIALKAESDRIEKNAPDFLVTYINTIRDIGGYKSVYSLHNRSGDAREVQITILNGNDLVFVTPRTKRGVPQNTDFEVTLRSDLPLSQIDKLTLIIHSWGSDRTLREQMFTWSSNEVDLQNSHVEKIDD